MAAPPPGGGSSGKPPLANGRPSSASLNGAGKAEPAVVAPHPAGPTHAHHAHHAEVGGTGTLTPPFVTALTTMAR
jgi:hypothetical protein